MSTCSNRSPSDSRAAALRCLSAAALRCLSAAALSLAACLAALPARGEDVVHLSAAAGGTGSAKLTGEVLDYTGEQLTLATPGGERTFPSQRVLAVERTKPPDEQAADERYAAGDWATALEKYQQAVRAEPRRWVRREIVAAIVNCHRKLDRWREAGDFFLVLVRDDPTTPYFQAIPIAWLPRPLDPEMETKARAWLALDDTPAAVLLGASHLLTSPARAEALRRLESLGASDDPRIAALAEALVWMANGATASNEDLERWRERVPHFPPAAQPGARLALGRALAQHGRAEDAALELMRVPILYGDDDDLSAAALVGAATALERSGDRDGAKRLYAEVVDRHSRSRYAADARQRAAALDGGA